MINPFDDTAGIASRVNARLVDHNFLVQDMVVKVRADPTLSAFGSVEDLAWAAHNPDAEDEDLQAASNELVGDLTAIRNELLYELWGMELAVSPEVLDELLFWTLSHETSDAILGVLEQLRDARVGDTGLVMFGLHSVGLMHENWDNLIERVPLEFIDSAWGIAVSAQTNSFDRTAKFLERAATAFGVEEGLPRETLAHWRRSRPSGWMEQNPLVVVRVAEAAGSYYGNEAMLLARLQAATVFLSMLASAQPKSITSGPRSTLTSRTLNNRETRDIHHYLVLSPGRPSFEPESVGGHLVPISGVRSDVVEMSTLRLDFDPTYWAANNAEADQVFQAVDAVYRRHLQAGLSAARADETTRKHRRWFQAGTFFQRSFTDSHWHNVITLDLAFELLAHDGKSGKTNRRVRDAIAKSSTGANADAHDKAYQALSKARDEIVHEGDQTTDVDLDAARYAFVRAFVAIVGD